MPRGGNSQFVSYFGLASGVNFNRPELVDGALDDVRVVTRALTPLEIAYLQDPKAAAAIRPSRPRPTWPRSRRRRTRPCRPPGRP